MYLIDSKAVFFLFRTGEMLGKWGILFQGLTQENNEPDHFSEPTQVLFHAFSKYQNSHTFLCGGKVQASARKPAVNG